MTADLESFGHLTIARRASGEPVRVLRSTQEMVFLAFNTHIGRLVELHVLGGEKPLMGNDRRIAKDRILQAMDLNSGSFMKILESGEDQGLIYYTSNLNEGEFLSDYIQRRGALPPATVYLLLLNLLNDLTSALRKQPLPLKMQFDKVMITAIEDTFLQLRICDFGLSLPDNQETDTSCQVQQICEVLFLMLTGQIYAGENPDRFPTMTSLPSNLRITVRAALTDRGSAPSSLERLREDIKAAHSAQVSSIQSRSARKQLLATTTLQPHSQLQSLLLDGVSLEKILGDRFRIAEEDNTRQHPFAIPCLSVKNDQPITVHLLPPSRLIDKANYDAVPLQSWRLIPEKHPHILRSLSLWESNDWSFLTEERDPGFTLSRLLMDRLTLNPSEVSILLGQTRTALDEALECSVEKIDLHPSNIFLRVGKGGGLQARELDRLLQKRIDAWPPFLVKLRAHLTMRHLYEAPLVESPTSSTHEDAYQKHREHRHRSFVALAAYLLTGERNPKEASAFPETIPESLSLFILQTLEIANQHGKTPSPSEFLARYDALLATPATTDLATRLRGSNVALEEMESVGSVSDFDDESTSFEECDDVSPISRRLHAHEFDRRLNKRNSVWPVWAAAAVAILGMLAWWLSYSPSGKSTSDLATLSLTKESKDPTQTPEVKLTGTSISAPKLGTAPQKAPEPAKVAPVAKVTQPIMPLPKTAEPAKLAIAKTEPLKETPKVNVPSTMVSTPPKPAEPAKLTIAKTESLKETPKVNVPSTMMSSPPKTAEPAKLAIAKTEPLKETPKVNVPSTMVSTHTIPAKATPPASALPITQPVPVTASNPIIIRKAILPSAEEIAQFRQSQLKPTPVPQPLRATPAKQNQFYDSQAMKLIGSATKAMVIEAQ
jgi:hypothetical protein